jgi:hypothetical protein
MSDSYKQNRKRFDDEWETSSPKKKVRHNDRAKHKQERVARHKKEILDNLANCGTIVLNGKVNNSDLARNK